MYIVAIAWLYVVVLMAVLEPSWVGGVMTFVFYGLLPLAIILFIFGTPERRRRQARREAEQVDEAEQGDEAEPASPDITGLAPEAQEGSGLANHPVSETDSRHA